jgi:chlorite dismutase
MERAAHRAHGAHPALHGSSQVFHHFAFYRIDPAYRRLLPNEKVVAKQEFLSVIESFNHRIAMIAYSLLGLRGDCDMMLWRVGDDLEALQEMMARAFAAGIGKYLSPVQSYLAVSPVADAARPEDSTRFLFLQPMTRTAEWRAQSPADRKKLAEDEASLVKRFADVRVRLVPLLGLEEHDVIVAAETARPQAVQEFAHALMASPSSRYLAPTASTFSCIRHELTDVLDQLG